jgi:hypothetical protein
MATTPMLIDALAPELRLHPSAADRVVRELRAAGLVPKSGFGGGRVGVHYDKDALIAAVVGFAAPAPAEAVRAVQAVKRLRRVRNLKTSDTEETLWADLGDWIDLAAMRFHRQESPDGPDGPLAGWELIISLDPVVAWIKGRSNGRDGLLQYADPASDLTEIRRQLGRGIRRTATVTASVLAEIGRLYVQYLVTGPRGIAGITKVIPWDETAAPPGRDAAAPDQPEPARVGTTQPYSVEESDEAQLRRATAGDPPSSTMGSSHDPPNHSPDPTIRKTA